MFVRGSEVRWLIWIKVRDWVWLTLIVNGEASYAARIDNRPILYYSCVCLLFSRLGIWTDDLRQVAEIKPSSTALKMFAGIPIAGTDGTISVLSTLPQMADALANDWPSDGPMFLAALAALVGERVGFCSKRDVHRAFIAAAIEAKCLPDSYMKN
jgi:hypothetical protein